MSYKVKGIQEVEININKTEICNIIKKEYLNLLGDAHYYRKDNKVYFGDIIRKAFFDVEDYMIRELTEEELSYAIALETTLKYFEKIRKEEGK